MAYLSAGTVAITILMALITAIGPLATDMYLPVLPSIRSSLGATTASTQATLSAFLIGYAIAQLFYGPVSDRKGRKPAMLFGLGLFTVGSLACALAPNIEFLVVARVLQALGGAGSVVLARAMVRDLYEGARAGRELARMGAIMALVPAVAPILGAVTGAWFGWRSVFLVMTLAGPLLAAIVYFKLPETLRKPLESQFSPLNMLRDFRQVARSRPFWFYTLVASLSYAGFFCFLSGSSFVLQTVHGLDELRFSLVFGLVVLGYMGGASLAQRIVMARGIDRTLSVGVIIIVPVALQMLTLTALSIGGPWPVILLMPAYTFGFGLILSQCNAGSLMPFSDMAGSASSLFSVTQMGLSATAGAFVGLALDKTPLALPAGIFICAALTLAAWTYGKGEDAR